MSTKRKPKFRVGQVVIDTIENLPRKILAYRKGWYQIDPSCGAIENGYG